MPLGGFQVYLFLWQGYAQPVAVQVMSEVQMFKVFTVSSQRESIYRKES